MRSSFAIAGLALAATAFTSLAHADDGDPERGKHIYKSICTACHNNKKGVNGAVGPSLYGVYGVKAASRPGFSYSDALKATGYTWDTPTLLVWEAGARKMVPGTKMAYPGLTNPQDRIDIIAYLKTLHD